MRVPCICEAPMKIDTYPFKLSQAMLTTFNKDVSDGVEKMQKSESGTFFAIIFAIIVKISHIYHIYRERG